MLRQNKRQSCSEDGACQRSNAPLCMHGWLCEYCVCVCVCAEWDTVNGSYAGEEDDLGNLSCFSSQVCRRSSLSQTEREVEIRQRTVNRYPKMDLLRK